MEVVLVGVATGVMKPVVSKLTTLLQKEYAKFKCVHRDARLMRDEMVAMSITLEMLADEEVLDPLLTKWRDDVRELSFDMEDCIDDFMARVADKKQPDSSTGLEKFYEKLNKLSISKLKSRYKTGNTLGDLKTRAMEASERHKRYNFTRRTPGSSTSAIDPRLDALYKEVDKLVGIEGPRNRIIDWFNKKSSSEELQVVSIFGAGGLGKSTLANQVYDTMKGQFSCAAFVSISRTPDMKIILRDMAERMGITHNTLNDDERRLIDRLKEHLKDKRYFVVIDDLWGMEAWETIRLALWDNNLGCRIITTTRNIEVARTCSSQGGHVFEMEPLGFDDSKRLFSIRAFGSEDYTHLEEVFNQILVKCAGLPLAIITLSSMLAGVLGEAKWKRVLDDIGSALAKNPSAGSMRKILSLSYFDLPYNLRSCLLILSVFPEDTTISKDLLIYTWIAEGFVHGEEGRSAYEVGEDYFNDLINRSLIQQVKLEHMLSYSQKVACRVHDIVLDFIKCKATEENFVTSFDDVAERHMLVRRLSVDIRNEGNIILSASPILSHVRSLYFHGDWLAINSLCSFPYLRVLDFGQCSGLQNHNLANIGKLLLLKYLNLGWSHEITELPTEIGELRYLETLNIRGTKINKLPSTFTNLKRLVCLHAPRYCYVLDIIIGQLESIEELDDLCVDLGTPGVSGLFSKLEESLKEFGQLTKLRTLGVHVWMYCLHLDGTKGVEGLERYLGTLISTCKVENLYLDYECDGPSYPHPLSLESWCPTTPCSLQKLHITRCCISKVPNWMSLLKNLRELNLCIFIAKPDDVAILGAIPTLVILELETFYGTNGSIFFTRGGFRSLIYFKLNIFHCGTAFKFEAGSMPKLEHLDLHFEVHVMSCVNGASDFGIQHLSALTKLEGKLSGYRSDGSLVYSYIEDAVKTLSQRPTLSLETWWYRDSYSFHHFKDFVEDYSRQYGVQTELVESFHAESNNRWRETKAA